MSVACLGHCYCGMRGLRPSRRPLTCTQAFAAGYVEARLSAARLLQHYDNFFEAYYQTRTHHQHR